MKVNVILEQQRQAILELHTRTQTLERQVKGLFARFNQLNKTQVEDITDDELLNVVKQRG